MTKYNLTFLKAMLNISSIFIFTALLSCESKFSETSPESVDLKGIPLEERLTEKSKVDSKIDEIQSAAEKAKRIVQLLKKVRNPDANEDVYTPLDFLLDLNTELKTMIPINKDGKLVRFGKITIPNNSLSDSCRNVETFLEQSAMVDEYGQGASGERLIYSLKTCGSGDQYLEAIVAEWTGSNLEFKFISKNIETIFSNSLLSNSKLNSTCKIKQDEKKILESLICENFNITLSQSETANIKKMSFQNSGETRFLAIADIFENQIFKKRIQVVLSGDGKNPEVSEVNSNSNGLNVHQQH